MGGSVHRLARNPLARRLVTTSVLASLGDWITFSALVVLVQEAAGSPVAPAFSVALVAAARLLPGVVFGPLVAPYAGLFGIRRTLAAGYAARALLVAGLAFAPGIWALAGLLAVTELVGALVSSTQEAAVSRGVDADLFPALNTATGAASYGMIPVGSLVAAVAYPVLPELPFALNAAALVVCSLVVWRTPQLEAVAAGGPRRRSDVRMSAGIRRVAKAGPLRDTVAAATIGTLAVVMVFSLGPSLAPHLFGESAQHGHLVALLGAGAGAGAVLAQRRVGATVGLAGATFGSLLLLGPRPASVAGVVLIGAGAAVAYVDTQARLQRTARAPEEFAAAFAAMKVAAFAAMLLAPRLWLWGGLPLAGATLVAVTAGGALWFAHRLDGAPLHAVVFLGLSRLVLGAACRISVEGRVPAGPAILAANHPSALDGVLGVWLDRRVRPVAKQQLWEHPVARIGLVLSRAIPTQSGALDAAVAHLEQGGVVWVAPEGRASRDPHLGRARSGAARMAAATGAAVVPMAIIGTDGLRLRAWRPWRRPQIAIRLGKAHHVAPDADPAEASHEFMQSLAAMLGKPYRPDLGPAEPGAGAATGRAAGVPAPGTLTAGG